MFQAMDVISRYGELISTYLPDRLKNTLKCLETRHIRSLEEIRIRAEQPLMGVFNGYDGFIDKDGSLSDNPNHGLIVATQEVKDLFYLICEQSVYAYQEDIIRGFVTLKGGHRAGICGTVVYTGEKITGIRDVSSISIRLSRQIRDCARNVFKYIIRSKHDIYNTLILSPPRCGKTTLLRDLCRLISSGLDNGEFDGLRTAVIDERSELAASYRGIPQNDLGPRTDILNCCRKLEGIEMMLRGMAPHVIIVDELGAKKDVEAVRMAWNAGVRLIATAHAFSVEDFKARLGVGLLASSEGFERIILLGMNNGKRWARVMNVNGDELGILDQKRGLSDGICRLYDYRYEALEEAL